MTTGAPALAVVVMAGGRGTRMRSAVPKHLHPLLGRPMVEWVLDAARALEPQRIVVVTPADARGGVEGVEVAVQQAPRGTGDAVASAQPLLADFDGELLVLAADTPLLTPKLLGALVEAHRHAEAAATVLSFESAEPLPYGRVVRDGFRRVTAIVEEADATPAELAVRELNASVYVFAPGPLWRALERLEETSTRGELRLPHAIRSIAAAGGPVATLTASDQDEVRGVNTPADLDAVAAVLAARIGAG